MNVLIHDDLGTLILERVNAGLYGSPEEVLTEALYVLWERDEAGARGAQPARPRPRGTDGAGNGRDARVPTSVAA
jgi:hypothetical protein